MGPIAGMVARMQSYTASQKNVSGSRVMEGLGTENARDYTSRLSGSNLLQGSESELTREGIKRTMSLTEAVDNLRRTIDESDFGRGGKGMGAKAVKQRGFLGRAVGKIGPIKGILGVVAGLFAIQKAASAFAKATVSSQEHLTRYSGVMATAFARLSRAELIRDVAMARGTGASAARLAAEEAKGMRGGAAEYDRRMQNIKNWWAKQASNLGRQLKRAANEYLKSLPGGGGEPDEGKDLKRGYMFDQFVKDMVNPKQAGVHNKAPGKE